MADDLVESKPHILQLWERAHAERQVRLGECRGLLRSTLLLLWRGKPGTLLRGTLSALVLHWYCDMLFQNSRRALLDRPSATRGGAEALTGCCTVAAQRPGKYPVLSLSLHILPAKQGILEVDPTRLELVTSAMRRQHEEFAVVRRCSEIPANKHIHP